MASQYSNIYTKDPYTENPYTKGSAYKSPTESEAWYDLNPLEKRWKLQAEQEKLAGLPAVPATDGLSLKEAFKPVLSTLQIIGGILNIPSAAISGAVKQLVDEKPGIDTQEYFRDVFGFKDQVSWRDVIGLLAEKNVEKNLWDNKWAQIGFGLALDIALDPLTYIGQSHWKKLNPKTAKKMLDEFGKVAIEKGIKSGAPDAALKVNRAIQNAERRLTRGFGFQIPFTRKGMPFKGKAMRELVSRPELKPGMLQGVGVKHIAQSDELAKIAAKRTGGQVIDDFLAHFPGYKTLRKLLNPKATRLDEVFKTKVQVFGEAERKMQELAGQLEQIRKMYGNDVGEAVAKFLEDPPIIDAEMAGKLAKRSNLMSELFVLMKKGKKAPWEVIEKLEKAQGDYYNDVTAKVIKALRNREAHKYLQQHYKIATPPKDLSPKWLMETSEDIMSKYSAHKMEQFMSDAGFDFMDMTPFAKYAPEEKKFAEVFPDLWKGMDANQQKHLDFVIDYARQQLDDWYQEALAAGLPIEYRHAYLPRAKPGYRGIGEVPELGSASPWFTRARVSDETAGEMLQSLAHQAVDAGLAKDYNHAMDLLRKGKLEGYPKIVTSVYEALYMRGVAHYKAMARIKFIEDVKQFGIQAPQELIPNTQDISKAIPELAGYLFDKQTGEYLRRTIKMIGGAEEIDTMLKTFDKVQTWWKILVTSVNPGFHLRNAQSNFFLGGIKWGNRYFNPKRHKQAMKMVIYELYKRNKAFGKKLGKAVDIDDLFKGMDEIIPGTKITMAEAAKKLRESGMIRKEFQFLEAGTRKTKLKVGGKFASRMMKKLNIAGRESILADMGEHVGSFVESQARVAAWLADVADTHDVGRSIWTVQEVFVNYQNLTQFERTIGRKVIPFWSWTKQNLTNQVKFVFLQPGRYAKIPRVAQAIEAGAQRKIEESLKPPYFKDLWMWQLPMQLPSGEALFYNPNFPFQDLNKLTPGNMMQTALTSMSPFLKLPVELIPKKGYDIFRGQPIERYPGYKAPIPGILQHVTAALPQGFRKTLNIERDREGRYLMNPKVAHAITGLLPFVNNTARMLAQEPTRIEADRWFKWVSYMWGVKVKPLDELTQQYYRTLDAVQERKRRLRELGL